MIATYCNRCRYRFEELSDSIWRILGARFDFPRCYCEEARDPDTVTKDCYGKHVVPGNRPFKETLNHDNNCPHYKRRLALAWSKEETTPEPQQQQLTQALQDIENNADRLSDFLIQHQLAQHQRRAGQAVFTDPTLAETPEVREEEEIEDDTSRFELMDIEK